MSHIAAALAKSKGKQVSPPSAEGVKDVPSIRIGPATVPVLPTVGAKPSPSSPVPAAPRPVPEPAGAATSTAKPKLGLLAVIVGGILIVAGASAWLLLKRDTTFAPASTPAGVATPAAASPATKAKAPEVASAESAKKGPSDELKEKVRLLPITGAAGGGSQRLSMAGKVYEPGDTVIDGLILQSIETEEIVFRDTEGNLYTRRL